MVAQSNQHIKLVQRENVGQGGLGYLTLSGQEVRDVRSETLPKISLW